MFLHAQKIECGVAEIKLTEFQFSKVLYTTHCFSVDIHLAIEELLHENHLQSYAVQVVDYDGSIVDSNYVTLAELVEIVYHRSVQWPS